ncbi:uncharacterized protein PODANS_2_12580 [Podospora anserina S mat+]|uniref:Podospora anserina S mat+ genomic DNA chromosome 2, supercontig 2 n=1 Tax=Podospora anserina (strain S / ATCC MYA-4624 / DSM 980 / FGSC 10383) TaxID=515849 RepID=B2B7X5_PODAN|nr:uncharacterized protein PODANS_2_12580 [Podospora anserina S mat+]CAP73904.1 unnamed protein product [Podospora anserina S mat+]CDP26303.1 Putative protein of unknown function [Podospora anserina S mat+]
MSSGNGWLSRQRKSDLVDLADAIGLTNYEKLLKSDLEQAIDEFVSASPARFQAHPKLKGYFSSRARSENSPVKREFPSVTLDATVTKTVAKRRQTLPVKEEVVVDPAESASPSPATSPEGPEDESESLSTALVRTPGRALSLAARLPQLPATPADVAASVERSTALVKTRLNTLYFESKIPEATHQTREWLSTVHSVLSTIALFELYKLRQELLPDRYAFTIPAINLLGTHDHPVKLPDMFALVTASFWGPALTWFLTSFLLPSLFGYFFNLSAAHSSSGPAVATRGRPRKDVGQEYAVDPLTFSIVKALATYVVYAQGVTFGGLIDPVNVGRINGAVYSGWKGVLVGTAVGGLVSFYDAVLRK